MGDQRQESERQTAGENHQHRDGRRAVGGSEKSLHIGGEPGGLRRRRAFREPNAEGDRQAIDVRFEKPNGEYSRHYGADDGEDQGLRARHVDVFDTEPE